MTKNMMIQQAFKKYSNYLSQRGMSKETIRGYQVDLTQFQVYMSSKLNGPVVMQSITQEDVEDFIQVSRKEKEWSAKTVNRKINSLASFFKYLYKQKQVTTNIMEDVERVKVPHKERSFLTSEEVVKILEHVHHQTIRAFLYTMANTGLRITECIHLRLKDVDFDKKMIHVINGKGGKDRNVPMSQNLYDTLQKYRKEVRPDTQSLYFFALKKTGTISRQLINMTLKEACQQAGINKVVTSHAFRHAFASALVQNDVHIAVIQQLLGHADLRTTTVYLHVQTDDMQEAVNTLRLS
ncbi:tyrosine-type recombinase/integrase [Kurthia gibsonii]|uniref:tyrosine-type recombinase/integrase n=1 Tax=Kurthia gibsonii TaxID=33946 RepID=UPI0034CE4E71